MNLSCLEMIFVGRDRKEILYLNKNLIYYVNNYTKSYFIIFKYAPL